MSATAGGSMAWPGRSTAAMCPTASSPTSTSHALPPALPPRLRRSSLSCSSGTMEPSGLLTSPGLSLLNHSSEQKEIGEGVRIGFLMGNAPFLKVL